MGIRKFNNRIKKFKENELFQDEMLKHTETYLEYIQGITHGFSYAPFVAVEKKLDFSTYVPEGFGTGDCIVIGGSTLYVIDFKYGKGVPVSAEENPQMKLALGAYLEYGFLHNIEHVQMVVVQPRLFSDASEYKIPLQELLDWGEEIKPIARKAFEGEGEFVPGEHCKFCKAKVTCRARADQFTALDDFKQMKPPLISDEEVGAILEKGEHIASWIKALKDHVLKESLKGKEITGWKVVAGRGSRSYVDLDKAFQHLTISGIDEAVLYDRVPLTVAKLEKELGAKEYRSLLEEPGHVQKSPGKPTLAPTSDKREAVTNDVDAKDDFQ